AGPEIFVGHIESGENRDLQCVPGRALLGGEAHLLVDEGRQLRHVLPVEGAADRVALSVDLDVDDAGLLLIHFSPWASPRPPSARLVRRPACLLERAGPAGSRSSPQWLQGGGRSAPASA